MKARDIDRIRELFYAEVGESLSGAPELVDLIKNSLEQYSNRYIRAGKTGESKDFTYSGKNTERLVVRVFTDLSADPQVNGVLVRGSIGSFDAAWPLIRGHVSAEYEAFPAENAGLGDFLNAINLRMTNCAVKGNVCMYFGKDGKGLWLKRVQIEKPEKNAMVPIKLEDALLDNWGKNLLLNSSLLEAKSSLYPDNNESKPVIMENVKLSRSGDSCRIQYQLVATTNKPLAKFVFEPLKAAYSLIQPGFDRQSMSKLTVTGNESGALYGVSLND